MKGVHHRHPLIKQKNAAREVQNVVMHVVGMKQRKNNYDHYVDIENY